MNSSKLLNDICILLRGCLGEPNSEKTLLVINYKIMETIASYVKLQSSNWETPDVFVKVSRYDSNELLITGRNMSGLILAELAQDSFKDNT